MTRHPRKRTREYLVQYRSSTIIFSIGEYGNSNICENRNSTNICEQGSSRKGAIPAQSSDKATSLAETHQTGLFPTLIASCSAIRINSLPLLRSFNSIVRHLSPVHNYADEAPVLSCATEYESRLQDTRQIALHVSSDQCIYRFKPGSTITVSIDEESFSQHSVKALQHLQCGLALTLSTLNFLDLGVQFRYIKTEEGKSRGFVQVRYGGVRAGIWAETDFPDSADRKPHYSLNIYSATFEPDYISVTTNILQHEFAHLLSMRHHPAVPRYSGEGDQVLFPAGDNDTHSIMGTWTHPGDLFFRPRDAKYLKEFFNTKEGDKIEGKTAVDVVRRAVSR
ncbi:hypothetical protein N0V93_004516 [Gnomoniopsis smithogilvyi]|uniref:Uncharacterized protein n=1 Tax=Gnomoniopsis smithogilvyi TaxID=1191159 RepID=A0A9W9CVX2_9PEZI|nr:hypothetical protein N0V93_004516 [Gnomoniopsis smithogilvyi]